MNQTPVAWRKVSGVLYPSPCNNRRNLENKDAFRVSLKYSGMLLQGLDAASCGVCNTGASHKRNVPGWRNPRLTYRISKESGRNLQIGVAVTVRVIMCTIEGEVYAVFQPNT
jgi:hypothetical protein